MKQNVTLLDAYPEYASELNIEHNTKVFQRYHCTAHDCKAAKYVFHLVQSRLSLVWYKNKAHSHTAPFESKSHVYQLDTANQHALDTMLRQNHPSFAFNMMMANAVQAKMTAAQISALPTLKQLQNRGHYLRANSNGFLEEMQVNAFR